MNICWCGLERQDVVDCCPETWLVSVPGTHLFSRLQMFEEGGCGIFVCGGIQLTKLDCVFFDDPNWFRGGDACWEGIRVYRGKILCLDKHLQRLFRSSKALGFENVHTQEEIVDAVFSTLAANGMRDHAHIRLTLTRGEKYTSSMNPKFNVYGTTLIILPEWKPTEVGGKTALMALC